MVPIPVELKKEVTVPSKAWWTMSEEEAEPKTQVESSKGGAGGFPPTRIGSGQHPQLPQPNSVICCSCKQPVTKYQPVLPFMAAYVCMDCMKKQKQKPIPVSEITNKSFAPWTSEEVDNINEYQQSNSFLPFVCPARHILKARTEGFYCSACPQFSLNWTYPWVLDLFWKQL